MFLSVVKEAFDSPCLPQNYKDEIEISELVEFCNKRFTEFFVFTAKRELDENFLAFEHKIYRHACGRSFLTLMMANSRKRLV